MYALRAHAPSGPEGLRYEQAPVPAPAIGDVLVHVLAASFTPDTEAGAWSGAVTPTSVRVTAKSRDELQRVIAAWIRSAP